MKFEAKYYFWTYIKLVLSGKISSSHLAFQKQVAKEVADAEVQLAFSNQEYMALQRKLEDMLATIAREAEEIKRLEQELREGQSSGLFYCHTTIHI